LTKYLLTLLVMTPCLGYGFEARVLLSDNPSPKNITGHFRLWIQCDSSIETQCSEPVWSIPRGQWLVGPNKDNTGLILQRADFPKTYEFKGQVFKLIGDFNFEGQRLEQIRVYAKAPTLHWVVHVDVESYLYGVLASEVPASWPVESLKAQAIASRTYLFFKKQLRKQEHYDVRSDVLDQVFSLDVDKRKSLITAVDETQGLVLINQEDSNIFPAYFHADCGGQTSSEGYVWRHPSSVNQAVKDPYCSSADTNDWTYKLDREKLQSLLKSSFLLPTNAKLTGIYPPKDKERAEVVDFLFDHKNLQRISANDLRALIGFSKLRSAHFSVEERWDSFVFTGRGFGHGVGMCQWGAQRWARQGKNYGFILKHYYPNARLKKLSGRDYQTLQAKAGF
jgi:SpoIID/LytB domain protein